MLLLAKLSQKLCYLDLMSVKCSENKASEKERMYVHTVAKGAVGKGEDVSHIT